MHAVIGALVSLTQNLHSDKGGYVGDSTYIAFLVLTTLGTVLAMVICNADRIIRDDGSKVILMKHPTWGSEILGLWEVLKADTYIIALFPMFLASNWFYTYQFNVSASPLPQFGLAGNLADCLFHKDFNLARFNVRTRALNSLIYWCSQIVGACIWGSLLDVSSFSRKSRARAGLVALFVITMGLWGGGYAFQRTYDRESAILQDNVLDWTSSNYGGLAVLYLFYGVFDSIWQT